MKLKYGWLLVLFIFFPRSAVAGLKFGLGAAAAEQAAAAIEAAETEAAATRLPACTETPYTVSPLALSDNFNIEGLGHIAPYSHTLPTEHVYFIIQKSTEDATSYDVYAPANLVITRIVKTETLIGTPHITDYSYYFDVCSGMNGYFHHVALLSGKLESSTGGVNNNCSDSSDGYYRNCTADTSIHVSSGEVIGYSVGRLGSSLVGLDFGTHDLRTPPLPFANPSRKGTDQLHTVCPVDYFGGDLRSSLRALLGSYNGMPLRTIEPVCGEYNQDISGKAQGNWYVEGTPPGPVRVEYETLALVHDNADPTRGVISVGQSVTARGLSSGPYYFTPATSGLVNRDFNGVTLDGNVYCYESPGLVSAVILLQMPTATTLHIERQAIANCGSGPWSITSSATTFVR